MADDKLIGQGVGFDRTRRITGILLAIWSVLIMQRGLRREIV